MEEFQPLLLQIISVPLSLYCSFWGYYDVYVFPSGGVPQVTSTLGPAHFSSILYLFLFRADNFNYPIFMFADSLFCLLKSAFEIPVEDFSFELMYFAT